MQGFIRMFLHSQEISQDLGRVKLIGQSIPYRHIGILGEGFDNVLTIAPVRKCGDG